MNEENNYGAGLPEEIDYIPKSVDHGDQNVTAPVLDDFDYVAPQPKNDGPQGVAAPVLDDMDYVAPTAKRDGPQGVAAPVLDDMNDYTPQPEKRGAPQGVAAPVLDDGYDYSASAPQKLILSDEDIISGLTPELKQQFDLLPPDKQQQVIAMRRQQLGAEAPQPTVAAPILDEDNYTPPEKKEPEHPAEPVQAAILDDEPELPKPQVSSYEQQELERIKAEAAKKAVSSQLSSEQKDEKESLRMMLALKEEQRQKMAEKGAKIVIVFAVIGFIAAALFYLLYSGKLGMGYKNGLEGAGKFLENTSIYIAAAMILTGLGMISGIKAFKSGASLVYLLSAILQVFPGLAMIPQHEGSVAKVVIFHVLAFAGTVAVFVGLSASECVGQFFSRGLND
ncbi:MAG: ABC transporter permease [Ruminococcus sp.]|nr:ABC transporter permease [Ruminococcus sp.]